jgi:hypothetical protein
MERSQRMLKLLKECKGKNTFRILLISIQFLTINCTCILNNFILHTQNMDNMEDGDFSPAVVVYVSF